MAQSLASGLLAAGHPATALTIADPAPEQRANLARFEGVTITADNAEAVRDATLVVLATKPQVAPEALAGLAEALRSEHPTLLSIAAGMRIESILAAVGAELPVVRAMPNTPALVGRGASAWHANEATDAAGRKLASEVLEAVGLAIEVDKESQLDAVTGISGSGPAYFFLLVEALGKAGEALGLPAEDAARLAAATGAGAMTLLGESDETPAALRERVTSPGGTTAAALNTLAEGNFNGLVARAVADAAERAAELGEK